MFHDAPSILTSSKIRPRGCVETLPESLVHLRIWVGRDFTVTLGIYVCIQVGSRFG